MDGSLTIGVLVGNANSPHTKDMIRGIRCAAETMKINILYFLAVHSSYDYHSYFGEDAGEDYDYQCNVVYDYADFIRADALIIAYGSMSIFLGEEQKKHFLDKFRDRPCVLLEERDEKGLATSIIADNYHGMYQLAEHLIRDHGYRELAYLSGPLENTDARERRAAMYDVCAKYHVAFDESRIAYGDYSSRVEEQVAALLERVPQMQALVCANDVMADTAYRVCFAHGLLPGHDIAITGYDDERELAETLSPALTTVLQDAREIGYMAVVSAAELCSGMPPAKKLVPAVLKIRESCGCRLASASAGQEPGTRCLEDAKGEAVWNTVCADSLERLLSDVLPENSDSGIRSRLRGYLCQLLQEDLRKQESAEHVRMVLQRLLLGGPSQAFPLTALADALDGFLDDWIELELNRPATDASAIRSLLMRRKQIHKMIFSHAMKQKNEKYEKYQQESWFLPLISRDMFSGMLEEKELYRGALLKLSALQARKSCLYILREPRSHFRDGTWNCPDMLYLAAMQEGEEVRSFAPEERTVVLKGCPDGKELLPHGAEPFCSSVFCLFSGEMQYGILTAEIAPEQTSLFYLISRQIGNMLRLHQLSREQHALRRELEVLVKEVREKNEVLNFISESDALTGCMNRRGFLEGVMRLNRENEGHRAVLLFADLDHLKEINDFYGHVEGDYSLRYCAQLMQETVGRRGVVGRIGGDEFCAMVPGGSGEGRRIAEQISERLALFNQASQKPYYIELSVGCTEIVCSEALVMTEVLREADRALYDVKKRRRKSVRKLHKEN